MKEELEQIKREANLEAGLDENGELLDSSSDEKEIEPKANENNINNSTNLLKSES